MRKKPSHDELQQKVKALEKQLIEVKESEAALRSNEQNYRNLYENAPIAYFSISCNDGSILRFNSEAERLLGYKKETLAQMNVLELYADTAHGASKAKALFERFQTGESVRDEELQMKRLNGKLIWVNLNMEPVKSNGGDVIESRSMVIDISKRKQAEGVLRESEEKFRSVTEKSPGMIFINKKGKVVYCNKKCEEVMGYSQEEFCSLDFDFFDLISEESKKTVSSAFAKHLKGQDVEPYEYRLVTKGGDELDAIIATKLIQYEGDTAILGIVTEITQRKKMEDALSESEAKFRALAESAPAAIIITANEDLIYVNPAFESITGFTKEEAMDMRFWDIVHPDMQVLVRERGLARQRGEAAPAHYEIKAVTKDGQERWFEVAAALINYGGQTATLAMAYDITDRKLAEKALQKSESRYRQLVETMNEGLGVADQDYKFTYVNDKFCKMLGYFRDEIIGRPLIEFVHDDFKELMKDQMARRQRGEEKRYELAWTTKDGNMIHTLVSPRSMHDESGRFIGSMGVHTNITDRIKAEEALREKDTKLERQAKNLIEMNTALKVLIEQRDKEKTEIKESLSADIKKIVYPYVEKLENIGLNQDAQTFVNILKSNINDLISPFASTLSSTYFSLTPSEIQIADLIKHGKTSKEIASMLNVSPKAVSFHRGNLRKKLGLLNKKINLRTYLHTFPH